MINSKDVTRSCFDSPHNVQQWFWIHLQESMGWLIFFTKVLHSVIIFWHLCLETEIRTPLPQQSSASLHRIHGSIKHLSKHPMISEVWNLNLWHNWSSTYAQSIFCVFCGRDPSWIILIDARPTMWPAALPPRINLWGVVALSSRVANVGFKQPQLFSLSVTHRNAGCVWSWLFSCLEP